MQGPANDGFTDRFKIVSFIGSEILMGDSWQKNPEDYRTAHQSMKSVLIVEEGFKIRWYPKAMVGYLNKMKEALPMSDDSW